VSSTIRNASFLVLLLATTVWGQQYVLTVPSNDYSSIQAALNAAGGFMASGDVLIEVKPGIYFEKLKLGGIINNPNHRVTLHAVGGQSVTRIDASSLDSHALQGSGVKNFTLDGFYVRNRFDPLKYCPADPNDPNAMPCPAGWRGLNLPNATGITVQNCYFDTTGQAMLFNITDPGLSSEITIVHNTAIGGQGTDPNDPQYTNGQAVNLQYNVYYGPGTCPPSEEDPGCIPDPRPSPPTGNHKLIVADNIFRTNGSAVRYIQNENFLPNQDTVITTSYSNGSLVMTGNDVVTYDGYGHNIWGGRGHIIAGNRFHDSTAGASIMGASGGIIENNIFTQNGHGLIIGDQPTFPVPAFADLLVRHNTIVNNLGAGIVYAAGTDETYKGVPIVYNNIVAFNEASGIVAVGYPSGSYSFVPIDFHLERNDVYGNTLKGLYRDNYLLTFQGITNPQVATKNYAGAINTSQDLSVDPQFVDASSGNYSLKANSRVVDMGATSRSIPSGDFARSLRDSTPDIGAFELIKTKK
jgi:parallel beta-helix repeat protein